MPTKTTSAINSCAGLFKTDRAHGLVSLYIRAHQVVKKNATSTHMKKNCGGLLSSLFSVVSLCYKTVVTVKAPQTKEREEFRRTGVNYCRVTARSRAEMATEGEK